MNTEVSFKLCLASSTILLGFTLRKLHVVTRENGESLLAVIFGALLPSLLLQVRFDAFFPYFVLSECVTCDERLKRNEERL